MLIFCLKIFWSIIELVWAFPPLWASLAWLDNQWLKNLESS